ncbi:Glycerophosphodiester phosphodiesterase [Candidatus Calditenuaceae archaeon HR02]|nr:Glycerophosphodiester phosphodiesterase [Candidatus Calditenuaceae archaeon HR02]
MYHKPLITAHRGFSGRFPENTLRAVKEALRLGVDGIEVDVRVTRDGVVILMHDETVERTTNGSGRVRDLTWSEIRRLDAGSWKGEEFRGEPVPRLDDVLAETAGRIVLHIEVKEQGGEVAALRIIRECGAIDWVLITSFHPEVIKNAYSLEPGVGRSLIVGWLRGATDVKPGLLVHWALACGANALALYHGHVSEEVVSYAHKRLLLIGVWTVNEVEEAVRLARMGVDSITTDYPDIMLNYMKGRRIT